ncbi:MAG: hypothetical protein P8I91_02855 [Phycisphaerales bacterium]|jgi:hypothetical protein|nr:hypothetical protein [Phycisphaerales bacterium]
MIQRGVVRLLVFIGILVLLNVCFGFFGVHEHIDIVGSIILTLVLSFGLTLFLGRRSTTRE